MKSPSNHLIALYMLSVLLVGCIAGPGVGVRRSPLESSSSESAVRAVRMISYRAESFTDPTFDISPDGRRLYFAAMGEVYVVPIAGGLAERLPLGAGWKTRPAISPDGRDIAFLSDTGAGISAWRSPLSGDRPPAGRVRPGFEATTLAWVGNDYLGSAVVSTSRKSQVALMIDYDGEHGSLLGHGSAEDPRAMARALRRGVPASMSADLSGNVFLQFETGIVRIDSSTGIENVVGFAGVDAASEPRVTQDGAWLGFSTTSGGTAHLVLKNLVSGALQDTRCRLNAGPRSSLDYNINPEPSYAFIPGQEAVVLERDGRFHRCTFKGVETPIPVHADVRVFVAPRIRPTLARGSSAPASLLDMASTADAQTVAFGEAGHLWIHHRATGQTRRISASGAQERMPAFSADGRRLVYVQRFQDQSSSLRVVDLTTGTSTTLLHSQNVLANPAWSADGRRIAFIDKPVTTSSAPTLRWMSLDGLKGGVVGEMAGPEPLPTINWDPSDSALLYTEGRSTLVTRQLNGERKQLLTADPRVWDVRVSPSRRYVALKTRDGLYVMPILLSSGASPSFTWSDIRSIKPLWTGGADNLQWIDDDSLLWTVQHKLMRASPGAKPETIAELGTPSEATARSERRAYVGATVISMDQGGTIGDAVIVTNGRTLEYVGSRQGAPGLTGIETTDLSGKWIVPGFIDVHAHTNTDLSEYNLPVSQYRLAELGLGVTSLFDPSGGSLVELSVNWQRSQKDDFVGPTTYGTGVPVTGDAEGSFLLMEVESYEHALVLASDLAGRGALMLKAYQQGTRQQRQWLARAALATGIGITAHEDATPVAMLPAIIDGITVEHAILEGALREDMKHFLIETQTPLTPTLLVGAQMRGAIGEPGSPDVRQQCLTLDTMVPNPERLLASTTGVVVTDYAELLNRGARVAIGGHGQSPGVDFHQELELLAIGGAKAMNLLQAATMNGAEKLGLERRIGSLVEGKDADFVVLDANPLDDIRNTRKIDRVVRRGRVVTWPAGPAPQSWKSARAWVDCQRWNFGLGKSGARVVN